MLSGVFIWLIRFWSNCPVAAPPGVWSVAWLARAEDASARTTDQYGCHPGDRQVILCGLRAMSRERLLPCGFFVFFCCSGSSYRATLRFLCEREV